MRKFAVAVAVLCTFSASARAADTARGPASDVARWEQQARSVTITRDDWGIPHVHGKTDADTVFGLMYAQAEDDFNRVETNYLDSIGRRAEAEGASAIYRDLRMRLINDPDALTAQYQKAPAWLKALMNSWADGLNYFLYRHPDVKPQVITRFEPWMTLTFSDGSVGPDIERVNLNQLEAFYGGSAPASAAGGASSDREYVEPTGSNGMSISPSITRDRHALLFINPHTSFFFREEAQMVSDQGLDAYGAITWGQFFIYQGFNNRVGWMHTSSGADNIDEYLETVTKKDDGYVYKYGGQERPVKSRTVTITYRTGHDMEQKTFTLYFTHHGPIERAVDGKWVAIRLMQEPLKALTQSYTRTKARDYKSFLRTMELHTNSSNNTIYADADGHIAYFHSNFIPKRDTRFDWTKPVDGSDPATEWHGPLSVDETPHLLDPPNGWLYNSNNWPWSAAGPYSPKKADFPVYVETGGESARGLHAIRVLQDKKDFTVDSLIGAAFDSYLTAFAKLIPALLKSYDALHDGGFLKSNVADQIAVLRAWDYRWSVSSVPTSLAVFWGEALSRSVWPDARRAGINIDDYLATSTSSEQQLQALATASDKLASDFGSWKTPWGDINRFQRLTGDIVEPFNDAKPSIPVGFTSSRWGSLASFGAPPYPGTKKRYGTTGNSFVAVVEFGDRVRARAVTAGGVSGHPASPHFNDEAQRYVAGDLREVYFYADQLKGHTEREYHPGS